MKKLILFLVVIALISLGWFIFSEEPQAPQQISDIPTKEEQRLIEENQLPPETVSETDMEDQSPESAEHN